MKLSQGYCHACEKNVLGVAEEPNHFLWLIGTVMTGGIAGIFWMISALRKPIWRCSQCGAIRD
jgi:hypothetical protein